MSVTVPARLFRGRLSDGTRGSRGFTLAELLVVVVVLVALAAVAVPIFNSQAKKTRYAAAQNTVTATARLLATGQSTSGTATVSNGVLTMDTPSNGSATLNLGNASIIADGSEVGAVNNLLTTNQASAESDLSGWPTTAQQGASAGTVTRSTVSGGGWAADGSASALLTALNTDVVSYAFAAQNTPVQATRTYMATATWNKVGTWNRSSTRLSIVWLDSAGGVVSPSANSTETIPSSGTFVTTAKGVAPVGAVKAKLYLYTGSGGSAGDSAYVDKLGFWEGTSTAWALPGTSASSLDLGAGTWCVAVPDPTDSTKYIRRKADEAAATAVTAASAAAACA